MSVHKSCSRKVERRVATFLRRMVGHEPADRVDLECRKEQAGNWVICPVGISRSSRILSLGIGNDVSFDREIISRYGCDVHAFDPTPRWVEWIGTQHMPPQFHFNPFAVGKGDTLMQMYPRVYNGRQSSTMMTVIDEGGGSERAVDVRMKRISTILGELRFPGIDILKMDIEGAEYDVIDDLLDTGIPVYQLLVEFHHRFKSLSVEKTKSALARLKASGFRIIHISDKCRDYCLVHEPTLRQYEQCAPSDASKPGFSMAT